MTLNLLRDKQRRGRSLNLGRKIKTMHWMFQLSVMSSNH